MKLPASLPLIVVGLLLQACASKPHYQYTEEQAAAAVTNWLRCDECSDHQLLHVIMAGDPAEAILKDLENEPESAILTDLSTRLGSQYDALKREVRSITIDRQEYIDVHVSAARNRIRARVAAALRIFDSRHISIPEITRLRRAEPRYVDQK